MAGTPPPFNPYPEAPVVKKGVSPWVWIVGLVLLLCIMMGIGGFLMCRNVANVGFSTARCAIMFDAVGDAMLAYADQNGGKLPPADGWQEAIAAGYTEKRNQIANDEDLKDAGPFKGMIEQFIPPPIEGELVCQTGSTATVVTYNAEVAGKKLSDITNRGNTVLLWERNGTGRNQTAAYVKQSADSGPQIMGDHREWFVVFADGNGNASDSSSEFRIETGSTSGTGN